jgi:hypothetical protein
MDASQVQLEKMKLEQELLASKSKYDAKLVEATTKLQGW